MTSVLNLIPKQPKKDFRKLFKNNGKIVRFTARFADPKPEDAERLFVVNFHLFDDTLSIHEPPQRNLGIMTGQFLEKGVHLNMVTGNLFTPEDFYRGAIIEVHGRRFELLDCDEYTRKLYTKEGDGKRLDLGAVLEKVREAMRQQFPLVRDVFRKFDQDKDGVLTQSEFRQVLEKFSFSNLAEDEVLTIMKYFDTRQDGQVSYNEFCDAVLDEDYTANMMKLKPRLKEDLDEDYVNRAAMKTEERAETENVRKAARAISDVIYKQSQTQYRLMKEFAHMTHENHVTDKQIKKALSNIGKTFSLEEVQRAILFAMPHADLNKVNYIEFLKSMIAIFHDMCRVR
jgi:Ca2+-binding EF-hand superfamily protein